MWAVIAFFSFFLFLFFNLTPRFFINYMPSSIARHSFLLLPHYFDLKSKSQGFHSDPHLLRQIRAPTMAFWWPLLVLALAYGLCRFLLMLIPPSVPSIEVDASDGNDFTDQRLLFVDWTLLLFNYFVEVLCDGIRGSGGGWEPDQGEQLHLCEFSQMLLLRVISWV